MSKTNLYILEKKTLREHRWCYSLPGFRGAHRFLRGLGGLFQSRVGELEPNVLYFNEVVVVVGFMS